MTPDIDEGDRVRRLLLNAVPDLRAPENRLASVAGRVRRRRWVQASAAGAACLLVLVGAVAVFRPGSAPGLFIVGCRAANRHGMSPGVL